MSGIYPFGEIAEELLAEASRDDFVFLVLADHLEEIGLEDFSRIIRDRDWSAFRLIHKFLSESGFDPSRMRLDVQLRRKGKFRVDPGWTGYKTFWTRTGFPGSGSPSTARTRPRISSTRFLAIPASR